MKLKSFLLLLLMIFSVSAFPETFIVTNNGDSGAGTFREALQMAKDNGEATKDYIYFNLPVHTEAERIITLFSHLPDVSSNLEIDASTQQGNVFGLSSAKVALFFQVDPSDDLSGLSIIGRHHVSIFALYIKNIGLSPPSNLTRVWKGIEIASAHNVQIGAAGKGNVMYGFRIPLTVDFMDTGIATENLTLKDNFFDIDADGETPSTSYSEAVSISQVYGEIFIGGNEAEGNLFAKGFAINQLNNTDYPEPVYSAPAEIYIRNNKIGVDYAVKKSLPGASGIHIGTIGPGGKNRFFIEDNVIVSQLQAIFIINNSWEVTILRNYIGTDKTLKERFPMGPWGIFVYSVDSVKVGSDNPSDVNYITGCKPVYLFSEATVAVNKNSFFCTVNAYPMIDNFGSDWLPRTMCEILTVSANLISGKATPNSVVELFYTDQCGTCSPETFFASTTANSNGLWQYDGPVSGSVVASATFNNSTSEFTRTDIDISNIQITNACMGIGGAIKGAVPQSAQHVQWLDEDGNVAGTDVDLLGVKSGKYKLQVLNGSCTAETPYIEVKESIVIDTHNLDKSNPSCNNATGYIKGISITNNTGSPLTYSWRDSGGNEMAQTLDLMNQSAGAYTLTVSSATTGCSKTFGPEILINTTGPNIDLNGVNITSSKCGTSTGSVTNVTVTGTGINRYSWRNEGGLEVSQSKDLLNQPSGKYTLAVTDESSCGPVYSQPIEIFEINGIVLDESNALAYNEVCAPLTGGIKGIVATGATSYKWIEENGNRAGTHLDLSGVGPGKYRLIASNGNGCSKTSNTYEVKAYEETQFEVAVSGSSAYCGADGSIIVAFKGMQPKSIRWVNQEGTTIGHSGDLIAGPGKYNLFLTDEYNCERLYKTYVISNTEGAVIDRTNEKVVNDECGQRTGSIQAPSISGGVPPYYYIWTDELGNTLGDARVLAGIGAGNYTLTIGDGLTCTKQVITYNVVNETTVISAPSVKNVRRCSPGDVLIEVQQPGSGVYMLYDEDGRQLGESTTGKFNVSVKHSASYSVSRRLGQCTSTLAPILVIIEGSDIKIASNLFSPNGDGVNDVWKIEGISSYPQALIQIFNRYGQKVFSSIGYESPFDGRINGSDLPQGVYYFIIDLKSGCGILSGNITIVR